MLASRIIDGDGHVLEDLQAIARHMPDVYRDIPRLPGRLMPPLDHLHIGWIGKSPEGAFAPTGPNEWYQFMEDVGVESAVLYPTTGLGYYKINDIDWAVAVARAYNNWLHEDYLQRSPRFIGMGLIPMQEPEEAVAELRRIVQDLGMRGAMLGPNSLAPHLGSKVYWPIYAAANELGCSLAVHGGCHSRIGMDYMNVFAGIHAIGHPMGQLISFTALLFNGIFDRFPNIRFGFLEAGVAWLLLALERCDGSYKGFIPYDLRGELIQLRDGESVRDHIIRHIKEGRIFVGCEGDEPDLAYAIKVAGNEPFFFSSDFPHEVNAVTCKEEIEELLEAHDLSDADKEAVLYRNSERFYNLSPVNIREQASTR
ncbi:MAG TPA: amidohydrolase family protein [Dehalococcoidia bacterium]|nr:amidohydrolase family protein [Dehalococcoidia bacterium]